MSDKTSDVKFQQGVAYAVAVLIRRDELGLAQEIWEATSGSLDGVDGHDAKPIRHAVETDWCETWIETD